MRAWFLTLAAAALLGCQPPPAAAQTARDAPAAATKPLHTPDVIYVPTQPSTVDAMLKLARVGPGDVLYDLGSGDGRIPIAAARRFGIRAVGIEIDPQRISEARANAKTAGVSHLVSFRNEDLFAADFRNATVVTLYLLPTLNLKLRPRLLKELKPGTRIVSHDFDMGDWPPEQTVKVGGDTIFLWTVPAKRPG
jgi:SAM-dependent methyltransferase